MKSVFEQLEKTANSIEDSIFKNIANTLIQNFINGEFYNQEELSKKVYVALSTITKFSKSIGYSGYRELVFNLKLEHNRLGWKKDMNPDGFIDMFSSIKKWVIENNSFIKSLSESIDTTKVINIYASFQVEHAAKYLVEILQELNKIAIMPRIEFRSTLIKNRPDDLNILILCSRHNDDLIMFFEKQLHKDNKTFLITTEQQRHKLKNYNFKSEIIMNYDDSIPRGIFRNLSLECLFIQILYFSKRTF